MHTQSLPPGSQSILHKASHVATQTLSISILNQSQKEQFRIVEHNIWTRHCQGCCFIRMALQGWHWEDVFGPFPCSVTRSSHSLAFSVCPDEPHGKANLIPPPPPLLPARWLSQIISVLDDRINRIILSQCLLSHNCMAILLVDGNGVGMAKQEISFCLLCGAENSTGKFLISMKGTLELTERKSNSSLLSFSISCPAQRKKFSRLTKS